MPGAAGQAGAVYAAQLSAMLRVRLVQWEEQVLQRQQGIKQC